MLPLFNLQPTSLANFETGLNTAELLPQEAAEPSAGFAELLRLGVETANRPLSVDGMPLPQAGNPLPLTTLAELEAVATDVPDAAPLPAIETLHAELLQPAPIVAAAGEGRLRESFGLLLPASGSAAPLDPAASRADLEARPGVLRGRHAAETTVTSGAARLSGKQVDPATLAVVTQTSTTSAASGAVAVQAAAPAASPIASALQDEVLPALRRPAATAAQVTAASNAAAAGAAGARQAAPIPALTRDGPAVDRRPLPQGLNPVQPAPAVVGTPGAVELPAPAQPGQPGSFSLTQVQVPTQAATAAPTPSPHTAQTIDVPVRDAAWGDAIGERVMMMASNRLQTAEIRLTPAELGPLRVQVSVDDGLANVTFHAQHAVTREAIEQALPRLRDLLADNGLTLNQANVDRDSEQGVMQGNRDHGDRGGASAADRTEADTEQAVSAGPDSSRANSRPDGLVDTFV